ncbi:hypothetical protein ACFQH6_18355 [Halobacteriaceae archaeon GCM10025711]
MTDRSSGRPLVTKRNAILLLIALLAVVGSGITMLGPLFDRPPADATATTELPAAETTTTTTTTTSPATTATAGVVETQTTTTATTTTTTDVRRDRHDRRTTRPPSGEVDGTGNATAVYGLAPPAGSAAP